MKIKWTNYYKPNGDRERARRVRQIAEGSLKADNGLSNS